MLLQLVFKRKRIQATKFLFSCYNTYTLVQLERCCACFVLALLLVQNNGAPASDWETTLRIVLGLYTISLRVHYVVAQIIIAVPLALCWYKQIDAAPRSSLR